MPKSYIDIQREYYAATADQYDDMHVAQNDEHGFALQFMMSVLEPLCVRSVLDIGSGTGRALLTIKEKMPAIATVGVEPSAELRKVGHAKGLCETQLIDGDAMSLGFKDGSFDMTCEFAVLHHIPDPSKAVSEMLRVSRKAIFISDCNNFGQGGKVSRIIKQTIDAVGLWPFADLVKTKGKRYSISDGDGLYYSYSVFNDYAQIRKKCQSVHIFNTTTAGSNLYRTASHVALLGIKNPTDW